MLGVGVAMLLTADLGSDGYSTFVNGLALTLDVPFWVVNLVVGTVLVVLASLPRRPARRRHDRAGRRRRSRHLGPAGLVEHPGRPGRPVCPPGARLPGARCWHRGVPSAATPARDPAEAAGLARDPPVPFKWRLAAWSKEAARWAGTCSAPPSASAPSPSSSPSVRSSTVSSRLMRLDVHQTSTRSWWFQSTRSRSTSHVRGPSSPTPEATRGTAGLAARARTAGRAPYARASAIDVIVPGRDARLH